MCDRCTREILDAWNILYEKLIVGVRHAIGNDYISETCTFFEGCNCALSDLMAARSCISMEGTLSREVVEHSQKQLSRCKI